MCHKIFRTCSMYRRRLVHLQMLSTATSLTCTTAGMAQLTLLHSSEKISTTVELLTTLIALKNVNHPTALVI